MIEAKAQDYFQGACDHILVPATEVPEKIWLVFSMELLATSIMSKVGSETLSYHGMTLTLCHDIYDLQYLTVQ